MSLALYYHRDAQPRGVNTVLISAVSTVLERTTHSSSHDACINYTIEWLFGWGSDVHCAIWYICIRLRVLTAGSGAQNCTSSCNLTPARLHIYCTTQPSNCSDHTPPAYCFTCQMLIEPWADEWSRVSLDSSVWCTVPEMAYHSEAMLWILQTVVISSHECPLIPPAKAIHAFVPTHMCQMTHIQSGQWPVVVHASPTPLSQVAPVLDRNAISTVYWQQAGLRLSRHILQWWCGPRYCRAAPYLAAFLLLLEWMYKCMFVADLLLWCVCTLYAG